MANEIGATQLDGVIPELWSREVHRGRYSVAIAPRVAYVELSDEMKGKGDKIHLHNFPRLSVNDVSAAGAVTNQQITIADVSLDIDKWKEATVEIVDKNATQSLYSDEELANKFAAEFGPVLGEKSDNDLFALYGSITYPVGDGTSVLTDTLVRAALQKLDELRIPKTERNFVLSPKAFWDLFGQDKYLLAYATGLGKGMQIQGPEKIPGLYGCGWFETAEVSTLDTVHKNLLLHKQCLAMGMQKTVQIVKFAKIALTTRINGNCLYGVKAFRADHGIVINTVSS